MDDSMKEGGGPAVLPGRVPAIVRRTMAAALAGLVLGGRAEAQARPQTPDGLLARDLGLSPAQLAAISRGETVGAVLPTADERDVVVFAAVHVSAPRSFFVARLNDLPAALRTPTRTQVERFSNPAVDADVHALQVTPANIKDLRGCRPGACNFKLPATDMQRLHTTFDWAAPNVGALVSAYFRSRMVDFVGAYRRSGNGAMLEYDDTGPVHGSDAFAAMLRDSTYVLSLVPSFVRHLIDFPRDTLPGGTDFIFWSIDQLPHARPVLRITHETVYAPPELQGTTILADKQIYADHYFEAGLEVLLAFDPPVTGAASASRGFTLLAVRHYRFDKLPSGGLLNIRGRAVSGLRQNAVADLARLRTDCEVAWRASGTAASSDTTGKP